MDEELEEMFGCTKDDLNENEMLKLFVIAKWKVIIEYFDPIYLVLSLIFSPFGSFCDDKDEQESLHLDLMP